MRQFGSLKSPSICPQLTGTQLVRDTHGITKLDMELASYGNYIIGYQLYQIFINIIIQSTNRLNFCLEILCISLDLIRARIKHKQHQCLERPVWGPDESSNVATGNSTHKHRILSTLSFVNTQMVNGKYCRQIASYWTISSETHFIRMFQSKQLENPFVLYQDLKVVVIDTDRELGVRNACIRRQKPS